MLLILSLLFVAYCYALVVEFDPEVESRRSDRNTMNAMLSSFEISSTNMPVVHKVLDDSKDVFHKIYASIKEPQNRIAKLAKFMANVEYHKTVFSGAKLAEDDEMLAHLFVQKNVGYYGEILESLPPIFEDWPPANLVESILSNVIAHSFSMVSSFDWLGLYLEHCQKDDAIWLFEQMYPVMNIRILSIFVGSKRQRASRWTAKYLLEDHAPWSELLIRVLTMVVSGIEFRTSKDQKATIQKAWAVLHQNTIDLPTDTVIDSKKIADLCSKALGSSGNNIKLRSTQEAHYQALFETVLVMAESIDSRPAWSVVSNLVRRCTSLEFESATCRQIVTRLLSKLDPDKTDAMALQDILRLACIGKGYAPLDESLLRPFPRHWLPSFFRTDRENQAVFMRHSNFEIFNRKMVAKSTSFPRVFDNLEKTYDLPWNAFIATPHNDNVWIGTAAIDYAERFMQAQKDGTVDNLEYDVEMSVKITVLAWLYLLATGKRLISNGLLKTNRIQNDWEDFLDDITGHHNLDESATDFIDNLLDLSQVRDHFTVYDFLKTISNVTDDDFPLISSDDGSSNSEESSDQDEESNDSQDVGSSSGSQESSHIQNSDSNDSGESHPVQNRDNSDESRPVDDLYGSNSSSDESRYIHTPANSEESSHAQNSNSSNSSDESSHDQTPDSDNDSLSEAAHIIVNLGIGPSGKI